MTPTNPMYSPSQLLEYHRRELPQKERQEMNRVFLKYRYYFALLGGLAWVEKEDGDKGLDIFINQVQKYLN